MGLKRVVVDLSHIFKDYRKKAYVLIRPEWDNIECFQSQIINLFGLEHYIYITSPDGVVFPSAERVDVIDHNDVVVVHKISVDELLAPNPVLNDKEIAFNQKHKTNGNQNNATLDKTNGCSSDSIDLQTAAFQKLEHLQIKRQAPPSALSDIPVKRRRKRVRKRKTKLNGAPKPSTSVQEVSVKPTPIWSNNPKNMHVRFSDASSSLSSSEISDSDENFVKVCRFKQDVVPRSILPKLSRWDPESESYQPYDEDNDETTETPPNLRLDIPAPVIDPIQPNRASDHLEEAQVPSIGPIKTPTTTLPTGPSTATLEELRKEIEHLNLPVVEKTNLKVSDTIAFKILRMDDQCQPTISNYIIGCVERINSENEELAIRLLAGKEEIGSRICMTVITENNEIGTVEEDHIEVTFGELYEPRYCLFTM